MNHHEPPKLQRTRPRKPLLGFVALVACVLLVFVGITISGFGLFRILETTPFMGIPVDAQGNPLPVQGYPQVWCGLAITIVFSSLALLSACYLLQRRHHAAIVKKHSRPGIVEVERVG